MVVFESVFVRIYDAEGNKLGKGKIQSFSIDSLTLKDKKHQQSFSIKNIDYLKTKRAPGHNILIGTLSGAAGGILVGALSGDEEFYGYSAAEGAAGFGFAYAVIGAGIGGFTAIFKKSKTFMIEGESEKWEIFTRAMTSE